MPASGTRKKYVRLMILSLGVTCLAAMAGCGGEASARRGLKRVVYREIKQFNRYHQREVKSNVYQSGGRFYKTFKEREDSRYSMRRTNSVGTPYVATLSFTENTYLTQRRTVYAEAKKDGHFSLAHSGKREIIYAYIGGLWKKKETY